MPERILKVFAKNLERLLEKRNMTQTVLSERAGINRGQISRYLACTRYPSLVNVEKIAHALHVEYWDLFRDVDSRPSQDDLTMVRRLLKATLEHIDEDEED